MNKSITSVLVAAALTLSVGTAFAQEAGRAGRARDGAAVARDGAESRGHGRRGHGGAFSPEAVERRIARLTERLSLDTHQVALVREILASARTEGEALRAAGRSPERRAQFRALMERTAGRIDAILNDTQRAQFTAMRTARRERMEARRAHRSERREERGEGRRERREAGGERGI